MAFATSLNVNSVWALKVGSTPERMMFPCP